MNPDQLGGIILETGGHPGAPQASSDVLPPDYHPAPPPLNVKVVGDGEKITLSGKVPPEVVKVVAERSETGDAWTEFAEIDPKTIPGPPGPKNVSAEDTLAIGSTAWYRLVAHTKDREPVPLHASLSLLSLHRKQMQKLKGTRNADIQG